MIALNCDYFYASNSYVGE